MDGLKIGVLSLTADDPISNLIHSTTTSQQQSYQTTYNAWFLLQWNLKRIRCMQPYPRGPQQWERFEYSWSYPNIDIR